MPAASKNQQQLMGMAYAYATGRRKDVPEKAKEIARSFMKGKDTDKKLTKKQKDARKKRGIAKLKDFASTKHKNLPEVLESKVYNFEEYMQIKREF